MILTDSVDKQVLWSTDGQRLATSTDHIYGFVDGLAVTTKPRTDVITGFFDTKGTFTPVSDCRLGQSKPRFSNGHLLVTNGYDFMFVNTEGKIGTMKYETAYPFTNGYASCSAFANFEKRKDPYNLLLGVDDMPVSFSFNGKPFKNDEIDFVSSVNDENIGFVIVKKKLFYFNGIDRTLTPVFATQIETDIKNQAKLANELSQCFFQESDSISVLHAKCGKKDVIEIRFDTSSLIPVSIKLIDGEYTYKKNEVPAPTYETPLTMTREGGKYGICWGSEEMLPPQFDDLIACFGEKAFVRLSGKCGMLKILKDERFKVTVNKGNSIDFWHQRRETTLRLDLPTIVSAYDSKIMVTPDSGCDVDMPSEEKKDTEHGNYIQYDCTLQIPNSLPDEMYDDERNIITYPVQVVYNGLKSPVIPCKVKAWHYKYFNVDIDKTETSIYQGDVLFTFDIKAEVDPNGVKVPLNVSIQTEALQYELESLSSTRYKCKVLSLREGVNDIVVNILEEGCPPAPFPFEVSYTKPVEKTKKNPEVKESVVIRKVAPKKDIIVEPL